MLVKYVKLESPSQTLIFTMINCCVVMFLHLYILVSRKIATICKNILMVHWTTVRVTQYVMTHDYPTITTLHQKDGMIFHSAFCKFVGRDSLFIIHRTVLHRESFCFFQELNYSKNGCPSKQNNSYENEFLRRSFNAFLVLYILPIYKKYSILLCLNQFSPKHVFSRFALK